MPRMSTQGLCSVSDCERPIRATGLCSAHYERVRNGIPLGGAPIADRKVYLASAPDFIGCAGCERLLPKVLFVASSTRGTIRRWCRFCVKLKNHGLDMSRFSELVISQSGLCPLCESQLKSPSVDHDHRCCANVYSCGSCIRGVLCRNCNSALGLAGDSVKVLSKMVTYLKDSGI